MMFSRTRLACSFCGKSATEVSKLVAGPKVYICDVCVATASRLMSDPGGTTPQAPSLSPTLWQWFVGRLSRLRGWLRSRGSRPLLLAR